MKLENCFKSSSFSNFLESPYPSQIGYITDNCSSGVAISINNAGVAHASSLGGHTLEADVVGAYSSATGNFVDHVITTPSVL
uniref:Uncharacterized protein n=1 Tax=Tanacetum cinerariifolium TaxID=118510 RepID=A0A6L2P1Z5_TANCI|nr:hypothetical protein [Tanacetum cinerariifolium]